MACKHCGADLIAHEGDEKAGLQHCNGCGCCFLPDGITVRPGHPACAASEPVIETTAAPSSEFADPSDRLFGTEIPLSQPEGDTEGKRSDEAREAAPEDAPRSPARRTRRGAARE